MADEIKLSCSIVAEKNNLKFSRFHSNLLDDWTTARGPNPGTVAVGTSEEDISFGDAAPGWVIIKNLDSTNFVKYGPKSGAAMVDFGRLYPGMASMFYLASGVTLRMIADTAACDVLIEAINT